MGNTCEMPAARASSTCSPSVSRKKLPRPFGLGKSSAMGTNRTPYSPADGPGRRRFSKSNTFLCVSPFFGSIVEFLHPVERHRVLCMPLCAKFSEQTVYVTDLWSHMLFTGPLNVPREQWQDLTCHAKMRLHRELAQAYVEIPRAQTVDEVADAIRRFSGCCSILSIALDALNFIVEDDNQRKAAQMSDMPLLTFKAMKRYSSNGDFLCRALYSSMLMLRPKGGSEGCLFKGDEMSSVRIGAVLSEGVSAVLDSMRLHLDNPRLQYMGCWSLVNMALEPTHKAALLSAGVVDVISDAMDRHVHEPKVQFRALFALINLVTVSGIIQPKTVENLIHRVVDATERFITYPDVAGRGCMVLYNMSLDRSNHAMLKTVQVPAVINRASELHTNDRLLKFVASSTACRLA